MKAFVTGSHKYGTPTPDSDIDLVILTTSEDAAVLASNADTVCSSDKYGLGECTILRYGDLNLICCVNKEQYVAWKLATQRALDKVTEIGRFLTRKETVPIFRSTFEQLGVK